jgi:hypothetical protein
VVVVLSGHGCLEQGRKPFVGERWQSIKAPLRKAC